MQRLSTYKRKAGVLFMDTRPVYFGKIFFQKPKAEKAWAALSRNALAQRKDGYKRQKKRKPLHLERLPPYIYFQSLKMSANAKSSAVFMLFSIKDRISASNTDFFFFLLRSFT